MGTNLNETLDDLGHLRRELGQGGPLWGFTPIVGSQLKFRAQPPFDGTTPVNSPGSLGVDTRATAQKISTSVPPRAIGSIYREP